MDARPHRPRTASGVVLDAAVVASLGAATVGCNLVVGDYSVVGTHWECVGSVGTPAAGADVPLTIAAVQFAPDDGAPVAGVTIHRCGPNDMPCASPTDAQTTGANGEATFMVPSGFEGYFDATAPGMMESLIYVSLPIVSGMPYRLPVGTYDEYKMQVTAVTGTVDDEDGAIFVNTEECLGQPAAGVTLSLGAPFSAGTDPFYYLDGKPEDATDAPRTDADAVGGFADVAPGLVTVAATVAASGQLYALPRVRAHEDPHRHLAPAHAPLTYPVTRAAASVPPPNVLASTW